MFFKTETSGTLTDLLNPPSDLVAEIDCVMVCDSSSQAVPEFTEIIKYYSVDQFPFEFNFSNLYTVTGGEVTYGFIPELPDGLSFETNQNGTGIVNLTSKITER